MKHRTRLERAEQPDVAAIPLAKGQPLRRVARELVVALEPVSNFILLERYAPDCTAATWTQALETALAGLPVTVIQGTSDEAKALRRHIEKDLGAQHGADLFHGQHEVMEWSAPLLPRALSGHNERSQHRQPR